MTTHNDDRNSMSATTTTPTLGGRSALAPVVRRQVATLERRAPRILERATTAGVPIEYVGVAPLFKEARLYSGPETDWTFGPVDSSEDPAVPRAQRQTLATLRGAGLNFPLLYIAHEVQKTKTKDIVKAAGSAPTTLDRSQALDLIGPAPMPLVGIETSERLGQHAGKVIQALITSGKVAGTAVAGATVVAGAAAVAIAAAPLLLVGGAVAALGTVDPMVIGAVPAGAGREGELAAWFVLCHWDW